MTIRLMTLILAMLVCCSLVAACDDACKDARLETVALLNGYQANLRQAAEAANHEMADLSNRAAHLANEGSGQGRVLEAQAASSAAAAEGLRLEARAHEVRLISDLFEEGRIEDAAAALEVLDHDDTPAYRQVLTHTERAQDVCD